MSKYKKGLDNREEAIFSDHYFTKHADKLKMTKDSGDIETIVLDEKELKLIADLNIAASEKHIEWLKTKISTRIEMKKISQTKDVFEEIICERQFTRGARNTCNWNRCTNLLEEALESNNDIRCIIVGLPFKMPTILKCNSTKADLGEASFLLQLYEFCKVSEYIIKQYLQPEWQGYMRFKVITDAKRFMNIVNIDQDAVNAYKASLEVWIDLLGIRQYVSIEDYTEVIMTRLPKERIELKEITRSSVEKQYKKELGEFISASELHEKLKNTIKKEPDPEKNKTFGRFVSLFLSMIFTMKYTSLFEREADKISCISSEEYINSIDTIIRILNQKEKQKNKIAKKSIEVMLNEAWNATIKYIAEIRSDRDMDKDILEECFPQYIRWTIHKKSGQICIAARTLFGINLMPWHGVGMLKESGNTLKQYVIPYKMIEQEKSIKISAKYNESEMPITYIDKEIIDNYNLYDTLKLKLTRKTNG